MQVLDHLSLLTICGIEPNIGLITRGHHNAIAPL